MQHTNTRRGFTLIELLVGVLIIAILAAVAVPQYQKVVLKSRYHAVMPLVEGIAQEQALYFLEHGEYAPSISSLGIGLSSTTIPPWVNCYMALQRYNYAYCLVHDTPNGNPIVSYVRYFHNNVRKCVAYGANNAPGYELCRRETGDTNPHPANWFTYPN